MSIRWDKRNKRWRFEFDRYIAGKRSRSTRLLPKGWSQTQADEFDRKEGARLYAVASGVRAPSALILKAVDLYLADKADQKGFKKACEHLAALAEYCLDRTLDELPDVAREVVQGESKRLVKRHGKMKPVAPATIRNRLAYLKAACRWAWKAHGICEHDPTARMLLPQVKNERHVYLDRQQMLQLARAAKHHQTGVAFRVAFYTGWRMGELYRLQVLPDRLVLADSKNDDRRALPIHPRIARAVKHLPLTIKRSTLQKDIGRAKAACGLTGISTFHDMRHSAASELVNAGEDLFTVGQVLGHRDPRSTKRYAHLRTETLAAAVGKIGKRRA